MDPTHLEDTWHGSVTVGERGQVVIPASVREALEIKPSDKLLVFVPPTAHGVVFIQLQHVQAMIETLTKLGSELEGEQSMQGTEAAGGDGQ